MQRATKLMVEQLMDCYQREQQGLPPYNVKDMRFQKALYVRGLIYAKIHRHENAKPVMAFFITQKGKDLLANQRLKA